MRKYEAAALLPDGTISENSHVAPATALFEDATTAFARGTLIPTTQGPIAVEDLLPGDRVMTTGGAQIVQWIGSTTYVPGIPDDVSTLQTLTRVTCDAFGPGRPAADLLLGPAARMVLHRPRLKTLIGQERILVPVSDFADGDRIVTVTPVGSVQMFHFMLRRHGTVQVGGVEVETYHPGKAADQAMGANLRALFLSLFPNIDALDEFGELTLTRSTREVLDSLAAV